MKWTKEQSQAIEYRDKNLLVAAGAGSGKTSVLVERIVKRVIDDDIDVDKLLVVTFTSAAAGEMRERVYQSIQDKLEEVEDPSRLLRQQALLSKAYITTIHSFCQNLIRTHFIESGIISSYRVADESESDLLKEEVLADVLEKWYEKKDPNFHRLVEIYGGKKNDKALVEVILQVYTFILSFPWPLKWLDDQTKLLNPSAYKDFGQTIWGKEILAYIKIAFNYFISEISRGLEISKENGIDPYIITLTEDLEKLKAIDKEIAEGSWSSLFPLMDEKLFGRMNPKRKIDDPETSGQVLSIRRKIKGEYEKIAGRIFTGDQNSALDELEEIYKDMSVLNKLLKDLHKELAEEKKKRQIIDFSDFEHMALDLLVKKVGDSYETSDLALRLQEEFLEVYIDEYQDTNLIQEEILSRLSKDNNRFFVGDIKQSIYSFRNARPDLFLKKYEEYKKESKENKLVRLFSNFRSRENIVGTVNYLFSKIMSKETASLDYSYDEYLNYAAGYYDTNDDRACEILIVNPEKGTPSDEKQDLEATLVARRIKELIREGLMVYDKSTKTMTKASFKDFVLLARSSKANSEAFRKVFASEGVPLYIDSKSGFFDSLEVKQVLAYLNIIDNPLQDIDLLTVLRSSMYNFNDSELSLIRLHHKADYFYNSLISYHDEGDLEPLRDKIVDFLEDFLLLRDLAGLYTSSQLIWEIVNSTGFYAYCGLLEEGDKKQGNIRLLFERAAAFDQGSNKGIFRFLRYMDKLMSQDKDIKEASAISEGMDVVRLMTIHSSKGLEFPFVFLIDADKSFNIMDTKKKLVIHRELGLGPSCFLEDKKIIYPSTLKEINIRKTIQDQKAEEMRLLYVALTRAREKLIITGQSAKDYEDRMGLARTKYNYKEKKPFEYYTIEENNFLDWILNALAAYPDSKDDKTSCSLKIDFLNEEDIENMALSHIIIPKQEEEKEGDIDLSYYDKVKDFFEWTYPYEDFSRIPSKLSVSDLKRYKEEDFIGPSDFQEEYPIKDLPDFLDKKPKDISYSQRGSLLHLCIQKMDFDLAKKLSEDEIPSYVKDLIKSLLEGDFIKALEARAIEEELLVNFMKSSFFKDLLLADKVLREIPFTLIKNWKDIYHKGEREGEVSVQGIIDMIYEKDGKTYLVDFKSDHINYNREGEIRKRYKVQMDLYKEAIGKIMDKNLENSYIYLLRYDELIVM